MTMRRTILAALALVAGSPLWAGGTHSAAGEPGQAADATQTVTIRAVETDDGRMIYEPARIEVAKGTTVRLIIDNEGAAEHELYLGTPEEVEAHAEEMARLPEMEHADPNVVRVDPGHQGEIHWRFTEEGTFTIACLMPGHMALGMVGEVAVFDPDLADASR